MNDPHREETLFASVLELPSDQRIQYLEDACAGDVKLRQRVEALLRFHDDSGGFMQTPAASATSGDSIGTILGMSVLINPGDCIGRYRILRPIGEGGCGVVYMAEQETPVRRLVALKVIKLGMDSREVVTRFEAERQALALMDHPNIARVFDGGATESGRPYFVMELVEGQPITHYSDDHHLSLRERLTLVIQVCQAVQHAHQKGIIHRDLKPSNVLVTELDGQPTPKVIDFGVAKATEQPLTEQTILTRLNQIVGTPAYMSPEQAGFGGQDIDTRSDLYSLGVLLYELLTGRPPFETQQLLATGYEAMLKTIREVKPPTPSVRLARDIRTLRATPLKSDAGGPSSELVAPGETRSPRLPDLRETIHAVRGELDWIVMKCLEKERSRRYQTASDLAADIQRHLNNEPIVARPPSKLYLLRKTVARHRFEFVATASLIVVLAAGVLISTREAVRANRAERNEAAMLRQEEQARLRAESAERRAEEAAARSRQEAQFVKDMLKAVEPGMAMGDDTRLLRRILDETAQRVERELASQPTVMAELCATLADTYFRLQDHGNALAMARKALTLRRSLINETNEPIARSLTELARVLLAQGGRSQVAEAESHIHEAFEIWSGLSAGPTPAMAATHFVHAGILQHQGRLAEAEEKYREVLGIWETAAPDPREVVMVLNQLGVVLRHQRKFSEALVAIEKALAFQDRTLPAEHPDFAMTLEILAELHRLRGKMPDAESAARKVLAIQKKTWGADHPKTAAALRYLADLLHRQRKEAEVATLYHEHTDVLRGRASDRSSQGASAKADWIGGMLRDEGRFGEAAAMFREAADLASAPRQRAYYLLRLAETTRRHGRLTEAEDTIREAITVDGTWYRVHFDMARLHADGGRFRDAEAAFRAALDLTQNDAHGRLEVLMWQAPVIRALGRPEEADALAREAAAKADAERLITLAWRLATSPEAIHRSGGDAVIYAESAVVKSGRTNAKYLDTLAAAYAETGDFDKAVQAQKETIALETSPERKRGLAARLDLYVARNPYRDRDASVIQERLPSRPMGIPSRDPLCPANCLDLSAHYNAGLQEDWHSRKWRGNNLAALPTGRQRLAGVDFDVRGIVQLGGLGINYQEASYPKQTDTIAVGRICRRLHFLHALGWGREVLLGTPVAHIIISYADGMSVELPLRAQLDIDEWQVKEAARDLPMASVAWTGRNARGIAVQLFVRTWENPRPDVTIEGLVFRSELTDASPFLIAITAE